MAVGSLLLACTGPLFPDWALQQINVQEWLVPHDVRTVEKGQRVILGGIILETQHGHDYLFVARQLPLKQDLEAGPLDSAQSGPMYAVRFLGTLDDRALDWRNKFIVVGEMVGVESLPSLGMIRRLLIVKARCLHIWRTQTFTISEFPFLPTGYSPLRHDTYCSETTAAPPRARGLCTF